MLANPALIPRETEILQVIQSVAYERVALFHSHSYLLPTKAEQSGGSYGGTPASHLVCTIPVKQAVEVDEESLHV